MSELKNIHKLKELIQTQCTNGNWNYDAYMHGMANGMICAEAVLTNVEPVYLDPPKEFISKQFTLAEHDALVKQAVSDVLDELYEDFTEAGLLSARVHINQIKLKHVGGK